MTPAIKKEIEGLVGNAKIAYVSSVDERGFPNTKAMLSLQSEGLFKHYFSTNLFSRRAEQFEKNPCACVYFCDEPRFKGLLLVGEIKVHTDRAHKEMMWREGFECYYPDGVDTENYCVFEFTAHRANYYHGLNNQDFSLEEFENATV